MAQKERRKKRERKRIVETNTIGHKQLELLYELMAKIPADKILPCTGTPPQPDRGSVSGQVSILKALDNIRTPRPESMNRRLDSAIKKVQQQALIELEEWREDNVCSSNGFALDGGSISLDNQMKTVMKGAMLRAPGVGITGQGLVLHQELCYQVKLTDWYEENFTSQDACDDKDDGFDQIDRDFDEDEEPEEEEEEEDEDKAVDCEDKKLDE